LAKKKPTWKEPPERASRTGYDWSEISATLRSRPGEWLQLFSEGPTSIANMIRQEEVPSLTPVRRRGMPAVGFEVMTRNNKRGGEGVPRQCTLYLRYVNESGD
jgi:hypothetical protein